MSKYGNRKVGTPYGVFVSQHEYDRFCELQLLQKGNRISGLDRQVQFELIPAQYIDGKCVERAVKYIADFVYKDNMTGEKIVEDAKGYRTPDYIIKRKLMLHMHHIRIRET